jgi:DNA polymerase III delta subunit
MNPVYILTGPERGLRKRFVGSILKQFKEAQQTDLDIMRMYGGEDSVQDALANLRNESLFGSATVVFFSMMEQIKNCGRH